VKFALLPDSSKPKTNRFRTIHVMTVRAVAKSDARLDPPAFLARAPAQEWRSIVNSLPAGYFRPSDVPMLAAFCISSACHKELAEIIQRDGLLIESAKGTKIANPASRMMLEHAGAMAQMAIKLRLCPSARYAKGEKPQKGVLGGGGSRPWDDEQVA
jgi:P27 family predicted phage terminase small subunit